MPLAEPVRQARVLMVENDPDDAELIVDLLQQAGYQLTWVRVETAETMANALREQSWDVIISDFIMPGFTGLEALQIAQEFGVDMPFIIVSGSIGEDLAVQAMRAGAHDYLMKDRLTRLPAAVEREIRESQVRRERKRVLQDNLRQAEELKIQAAQLARTNLELERFAYLAAHDLQEPLRMVSAYAELLVKRYRPAADLKPQDAEIGHILNFITTGVDRMETLIRGLISYSTTLLADSPSLCPVHIESILEHAKETAQSILDEAGATLSWSPMPGASADGAKLRTIFEQLISNSVKFRQPEVPLKINVSARLSGEEVIVSFSDNGIGIDRQYWEQIFGLFKRLHRDDKRGLGMGLALSRRLVEQQGGRIWVESELDRGTTIAFTLRAIDQPESVNSQSGSGNV